MLRKQKIPMKVNQNNMKNPPFHSHDVSGRLKWTVKTKLAMWQKKTTQSLFVNAEKMISALKLKATYIVASTGLGIKQTIDNNVVLTYTKSKDRGVIRPGLQLINNPTAPRNITCKSNSGRIGARPVAMRICCIINRTRDMYKTTFQSSCVIWHRERSTSMELESFLDHCHSHPCSCRIRDATCAREDDWGSGDFGPVEKRRQRKRSQRRRCATKQHSKIKVQIQKMRRDSMGPFVWTDGRPFLVGGAKRKLDPGLSQNGYGKYFPR